MGYKLGSDNKGISGLVILRLRHHYTGSIALCVKRIHEEHMLIKVQICLTCGSHVVVDIFLMWPETAIYAGYILHFPFDKHITSTLHSAPNELHSTFVHDVTSVYPVVTQYDAPVSSSPLPQCCCPAGCVIRSIMLIMTHRHLSFIPANLVPTIYSRDF